MSAGLTKKELDEMEPDTIFASGFGYIEHPWFNHATPVKLGGTLEDDGRRTRVKWVAVRGGIGDWAIYHSLDANIISADYLDDPLHLLASQELIARCGAKLHDADRIREFVPCYDDAFSMYRH